MRDLLLLGKVAVITGGSRGLGLAIAQRYVTAGAKVVIASRSQSSVDAALKLLGAAGAQVAGMACDVADPAQVDALAKLAVEQFGKIDIWVNNAGISAPYGPTAHIASQDFISVINTNILGTYNGSVTALRYFVAQKSGKLINLLGRGDTGAIPMQNGYSSSKVWVRNFTKVLAAEYKHSGVEVFGFNPGLVRTEMLSQVHAVSGYESKMNPLRFIAAMWGNEADVPAEKALWLASARSDGKTGLMLTVLTGGFMLRRVLGMGLRRLFRFPVELMDLNVTSVNSALELNPILASEAD